MIEFSLRRDGMAGVWGVCGESGLPGEDDADMDAGFTMLGTFANCRLDALDERCICTDEVIDSVSTLLASRICWNLESCAAVFLAIEDSPFLLGSKLCNVLRLSIALRNSEILSSSVATDPELAPPTSARKLDPGCADEDRLAFPLLP